MIQHFLPLITSMSGRVNYWQDWLTLYFGYGQCEIVWYENKESVAVDYNSDDDLESIMAEIAAETPKYIKMNDYPELCLFLKSYSNSYQLFQNFLTLHNRNIWKDGDVFTDADENIYRFQVIDDCFYFEKLE